MRALVLTDIQNDFLPGGALAVRDGDALIPVANEIQSRFPVVVATQDWHPADHGSFAANHPGKQLYEQINLNGLSQTLWPVHCVQHSRGAELSAALRKDPIAKIFQKGTDPGIDSYSAFFDNGHRRSTGMGEWLKTQGISEVYLCGLTTDYCVRFTALDAVKLGFRTYVVEDACRAVNLRPTDAQDAIREMKRAGVRVLQSTQITKSHE